MDLFDKCSAFTRAKEAMEAGVYPYFLPLDDTEGTEVTIGDRRLVMISAGMTSPQRLQYGA